MAEALEATKTFAEEMVKVAASETESGRWIRMSVKNECGFALEKVCLDEDKLNDNKTL